MENKENVIVEKETKKSQIGDTLLGSVIGGPIGGLIGLGLNKYWTKKVQDYKKRKIQTKKDKPLSNNTKTSTNNQSEPKQPEGMFEPEIYNSFHFYMTIIYDITAPEENNFVYISGNKSGGGEAYKKFLQSWLDKYQAKYKTASKDKVKEFIKQVKERFKTISSKSVYITVPRLFKIGSDDITDMARNSLVAEKEQVIYNNKSDFDLNFISDQKFYSIVTESYEEKEINIDGLEIFGL